MADAVTIDERAGLFLASILARKAADHAAIARICGGPVLLPTGPGTWLAIGDAALDALPERLAGFAFVSDQSGAYVLYRIAGPDARRLLQRGLSIDLHPDAFPPGAVAVSAIAHIGVIVRALDDGGGFDVAVPRSLAGSFRHWAAGVCAALAPSSPTLM